MSHCIEASFCANVPGKQGKQVVELTARDPAGQESHFVLPELGAIVPLAQVVHRMLPSKLVKVPAGHSSQSILLTSIEPARHCIQDEPPSNGDIYPGGQNVH